MKYLKTIVLALIISVVFSSIAFGQLYIAEPDIMPLSPRIVGMGGAFISIADDEYSLFHNPAGLGTIDGWIIPIMSVGVSIGDIWSEFTSKDIFTDENGNRISYFDFQGIFSNVTRIFSDFKNIDGKTIANIVNTQISANVVPSVNLGVITKYWGVRLFDYTSVNLKFNRAGFLAEVDVLAYADAGVIAGGSFKVADFMYIGINLKYVRRVMIQKEGLGLATMLRFIPSSEDTGEATNEILDTLNRLEMVKTGDGVGSDFGILVVLKNFRIGLTITDWWGGTVINYFQANAFRPLESTGYKDKLKGIIPTSINIGVSAKFDQIGLPKWIMGDYIFSIDIRDLLEFKFMDGEPSFDKTFLRKIYMGLEFKLLDIPYLRNIFLFPLTINFGFHQGNISASITGTLLWFFDLGIAIWGEERGDRIGQSRVYNLAVVLNFTI